MFHLKLKAFEYSMNRILRNSIIVRSPNWLGDAIMAIPAMCCLKTLLVDNGRFCVVTPDNLTPLYSSIPWITDLISIGSGHSALAKDQKNKIKDFNAELGFVFLNSFRSAWYLRFGAKKLYGASNGIRDLLFTKTFKVKWKRANAYETVHQSEKYLAMVYDLGCEKWDNKYPEFCLKAVGEPLKKQVAEFFHNEKILVIAPGAAYGPAKRWDINSYVEVCRYWIDNNNGKVIIVGAEKEINTAAQIRSCLDAKAVIDVTGKTSLNDLMCILKKAQLCLSNDSGIMHLGSALDIKGIAIFGSTDPYATGPLSKNWTVVIKAQKCAPCFARECKNPDKNYLCLKTIAPKDVIDIIRSVTA